MPKMKLGAAFYALIAAGWLASAVVLVLRPFGAYADAERWLQIASAIVFALNGLLFAVGAVTRRGLAGQSGPWICRNGWALVVGLAAVMFVLSLLTDAEGISPFPTATAVFIPHWVNRLKEKYDEGVAEAVTGAPDEGRPPLR
ncbi:hypothetical protein ACQPYH_07680 [Kribbella sp. CA-245084]|uniref:hypothetical protein n=1 Tax=Kribbella sp. CA-245084 TaxID=3239940 RepID=UPI003D8E40A4